MQNAFAYAAATACLMLSACASAPSGAELDKLTANILKASFRDEALVKVDRLNQDDANRECSAADVAGKPIADALRASIEAANLKSHPSTNSGIGLNRGCP
ncbi:MAG: hypothetical protein EB064_02035 [Betaproteobacteria bacterium]|nr:hypothetical protein [Betaproteobacteria bacterium]